MATFWFETCVEGYFWWKLLVGRQFKSLEEYSPLPAPLPHVFQGHGKSVLTHHLHAVVTVDMGDLLHHLEQLENVDIMSVCRID